jgi:hypothetical protein
MGRHNEAVETMERAKSLDPRRLATLQFLSMVYWCADEAERGLEVMAEALMAGPHSLRGYMGRIVILDQLGRHEEAMAERLLFLRQFDPTNALADKVAQLNREEGWRAAMLEWLDLLERTSRWESAAVQWIAVGEYGRALDLFERSVSGRSTFAPFARQLPPFRVLLGEPRFEKILHALKLDGRVGAVVS